MLNVLGEFEYTPKIWYGLFNIDFNIIHYNVKAKIQESKKPITIDYPL